MSWQDDYYLGSSDYPLAGDTEPDDPYFDPWAEAERDLYSGEEATS